MLRHMHHVHMKKALLMELTGRQMHTWWKLPIDLWFEFAEFVRPMTSSPICPATGALLEYWSQINSKICAYNNHEDGNTKDVDRLQSQSTNFPMRGTSRLSLSILIKTKRWLWSKKWPFDDCSIYVVGIELLLN